MKKSLIIKSLIIFSFLLLGTFGQGQAQDVSNVGVQVGDTFNYVVLANDFTSSTPYLTFLLNYYNFSEYSVSSEYNLTNVIQTFNASIIPNVNDVVGVTVAQLPTPNTLSGELTYNYGSFNKTILTGFLLFTPVTFRDWSFWKTNLYNLDTTSPTAEPSITASVFNNLQTFNASLSLTFTQIPDNLTKLGYSSLTLELDAYYNATSGVANSEAINLKLNGAYPTVQSFEISRTSRSLSSNANNSSSNGSGPVPGFEAIALIGALPVVAIYYRRRK